MKWRPVLILGLAALSAAMYFGWPGGSVPRAAGPMSAEAFVWQRAWGQAEADAVAAGAQRFSRLLVLAGEVDLKRGQAAVGSPDYAALAQSGAQIGLVIRIEPWPGPFAPEDELVDVARQAVVAARDAGVEPAELQLDFDCGERKLAGYGTWVVAVRAALDALPGPRIPVTITALPAWLDRGAFARLARKTDGYVLQVHSLERPDTIDDPAVLCDPAQAKRWVERAGRIGEPFRVALPTYSYVLGFEPRDAGGAFHGIAAEGELDTLDPGKVWTLLPADADAMAGLVQAWSADRPKNMDGVVWFRLPVAGDQLNWPWPTLDAALAGRGPQRALAVEAAAAEPGLIEIVLENQGETDIARPAQVEVAWAGDPPIARDGLAGYAWGTDGQTLAAAGARPWDMVGSGQRITIAWMRFPQDTEVTAHARDNENDDIP